MKVAVVGATGMVGSVMLRLLEERNFPVDEIFLVASPKSVGKKILFKGEEHEIISVQAAIDAAPDVALFSAGTIASKLWGPKFSINGTTVIDNSSAWRMVDGIKLIIPEVNADILTGEDKLIANPNCSTIQMLMAIAPLHRKYKINRVVVSTYQSITGTGVKAVKQLEDERNGEEAEMAYPYQIDKNCLPHCDDFTENGYTKEEMKLVNETCKILDDDSIKLTATAVRVPVVGGHSEAINIEFENDFDLDEVREILAGTSGIIVQDNTDENLYPMPRFAEGKDETFVGRIRRDFSRENSLNMWVVADNLRKGAATNAIQIAEYLLGKNLL